MGRLRKDFSLALAFLTKCCGQFINGFFDLTKSSVMNNLVVQREFAT